MKNRHIIISTFIATFFLATLFPTVAQAQENKEFQKSFNQFKQSINDEFNDFKTKNDSIFYSFLKQSWKEFTLLRDERPQRPKPVKQPVFKTDTTSVRKKNIPYIKPQTLIDTSGKHVHINNKQNNYHTLESINTEISTTTTFTFYGIGITMPTRQINSESAEQISNEDIATYYKKASDNDIILHIIDLLSEKAEDIKLNGWGTCNLFQTAATSMYDNTNEQVLFTWFALLKSGYDVKAGYNKDNIFLLVAFDMPVYHYSYFEFNNKKYYLILFDGQQTGKNSIYSYEADYPEKVTSLSLQINRLPLLPDISSERTLTYKGKPVKCSYDISLIDFYKNYPQCALKVYFQAPLSADALTSLDTFFLPQLKNKTEVEKMNFLLNFIQHSIAYKTDEKQFGKENYFFAEETLYYPYADCEDRAVFLSKLTKRYVNVKSVAIVYPNHVLLGVNLHREVDGSYITYRNDKYFVADPTYIGATLGMMMPKYENTKPEIIVY